MPRKHAQASWLRQVEYFLSEGYGHDGPSVYQGDGQTEAEGVASQGRRGDALLWRLLPQLT